MSDKKCRLRASASSSEVTQWFRAFRQGRFAKMAKKFAGLTGQEILELDYNQICKRAGSDGDVLFNAIHSHRKKRPNGDQRMHMDRLETMLTDAASNHCIKFLCHYKIWFDWMKVQRHYGITTTEQNFIRNLRTNYGWVRSCPCSDCVSCRKPTKGYWHHPELLNGKNMSVSSLRPRHSPQRKRGQAELAPITSMPPVVTTTSSHRTTVPSSRSKPRIRRLNKGRGKNNGTTATDATSETDSDSVAPLTLDVGELRRESDGEDSINARGKKRVHSPGSDARIWSPATHRRLIPKRGRSGAQRDVSSAVGQSRSRSTGSTSTSTASKGASAGSATSNSDVSHSIGTHPLGQPLPAPQSSAAYSQQVAQFAAAQMSLLASRLRSHQTMYPSSAKSSGMELSSGPLPAPAFQSASAALAAACSPPLVGPSHGGGPPPVDAHARRLQPATPPSMANCFDPLQMSFMNGISWENMAHALPPVVTSTPSEERSLALAAAQAASFSLQDPNLCQTVAPEATINDAMLPGDLLARTMAGMPSFVDHRYFQGTSSGQTSPMSTSPYFEFPQA